MESSTHFEHDHRSACSATVCRRELGTHTVITDQVVKVGADMIRGHLFWPMIGRRKQELPPARNRQSGMHLTVSGMRSALTFLLAVALLVISSGCVEDTIRDIGNSTLQATFRVEDETFKVRITNPDAIDDIVDVWQHTSSATIPNGALRAGSGEDGHNEPWSWHLDPEDIEMAEVTIELCSGKPSAVEANLNEWLNNVGRYCPWSAELILLEEI